MKILLTKDSSLLKGMEGNFVFYGLFFEIQFYLSQDRENSTNERRLRSACASSLITSSTSVCWRRFGSFVSLRPSSAQASHFEDCAVPHLFQLQSTYLQNLIKLHWWSVCIFIFYRIECTRHCVDMNGVIAVLCFRLGWQDIVHTSTLSHRWIAKVQASQCIRAVSLRPPLSSSSSGNAPCSLRTFSRICDNYMCGGRPTVVIKNTLLWPREGAVMTDAGRLSRDKCWTGKRNTCRRWHCSRAQ